MQHRHAEAREAIHRATGIYTRPEVIDRMLDHVGWPASGGKLLDPGAGGGDVVLCALARLDLDVDDVNALKARIEAWEFHPEAAAEARASLAASLAASGWSRQASVRAAEEVILERDFLLEGPALQTYDHIVGNPPYWRLARLPASYRDEFEDNVPAHARGDLLHAYLDRCADLIRPGGHIAFITSDRWLMNAGTAELRERLGRRLTFDRIERLEAGSAFHMPKTRRRNTPPRVHPVMVIGRNRPGSGIAMGRPPVVFGSADASRSGPVLGDVAQIMIAPWMGPRDIFVVGLDREDLPSSRIVPCVDAKDVDPAHDRLLPLTRGVIVTENEEPDLATLRHIKREIGRMPPRGRRDPYWLPPTSFAGKLPLDRDALLIPRIARRLRAIPLPAGVMPINHNLVLLCHNDPAAMKAWLEEDEQQRWVADNAPPLDGGYLSITTTLMRRMPAAGAPRG